MPEKIANVFDTLCVLIALGALVPIGHALVTVRKEPVGAIVGHVILNSIFTMSAGLILVWYPQANTLAVLGAGALLSSLGVAGVSRWARIYLTKKLGAANES